MTDRETKIADLRELVRQFVEERDWQQFHSPKNLAMSLAIEAAELMEHFQWLSPEESRTVRDQPQKLAEVGEELADVLCYVLAMANELNLDLSTTLRQKMEHNGAITRLTNSAVDTAPRTREKACNPLRASLQQSLQGRGKHGPGRLVRLFEGRRHVELRPQEQRHLRQRVADAKELDIGHALRPRVIRRQRQRLVRRQFQFLFLEFVPDRLVDPLRVPRARREQVDHQQMNPLAKQVGRLLDQRPKLGAAALCCPATRSR